MERVLLAMPQGGTRLECWRKLGLLATAGVEARPFRQMEPAANAFSHS